jgi:hypothetical protein
MPGISAEPKPSVAASLCDRSRCLDADNLEGLGELQGPPVFILGHHRSGTTMLYELLERTKSFNIITAYHAVCYDCLLTHAQRGESDTYKQRLNDYLAEHRLQTRLIDNVKIDADMPEEYGMILYKRSGSFSITRKNVPLLRELCRKIQHIGEPHKNVLLKNPWDYDRFPLIHELLPNAKLVFIHRDPLNVLNSQIKALQKNWTADPNPYIGILFDSYAKAQRNPLIKTFMRWATNPDSRTQLVRRFLTRKYIRMETIFRRQIGALPPESHLSVRYEELCAGPDTVVDRIMTFLGVEAESNCDYASFVNPREVRLLPGIERNREALLRKFAAVSQIPVSGSSVL